MRSFKQYIMESVHTYDCTIKIVGEIDDKLMDMFKYNLKKFDPIEITGPTTTPIQKSPYGFPNMANQSVNIIKAKFRYPATEPMIRQMARLINIDENRVRLVSTAFDDSIDHEAQQYENQMEKSPVLTNDYPNDEKAKEAAKAYGNSYLDEIEKSMKDHKINSPYAGEKTKEAFDPFKPQEYMKSMGNKGPMTTINRPAKPKTGAGR
jgi:hypothetical protein